MNALDMSAGAQARQGAPSPAGAETIPTPAPVNPEVEKQKELSVLVGPKAPKDALAITRDKFSAVGQLNLGRRSQALKQGYKGDWNLNVEPSVEGREVYIETTTKGRRTDFKVHELDPKTGEVFRDVQAGWIEQSPRQGLRFVIGRPDVVENFEMPRSTGGIQQYASREGEIVVTAASDSRAINRGMLKAQREPLKGIGFSMRKEEEKAR